jgi:hypothetical protein
MSKKLVLDLAPVLAVAAFALVPATAQAATPPTVETFEASPFSVTQTSETLEGTVNPNGSEVTNCHFEYGTTTSYGKSVNCNMVGFTGTTPIEVHAEVTGLTANTTYHFRLVATNAGGTSMGADMTFKTLPNPPTVETKPASSVTLTTANLNGSVNGAKVSECMFEYGTTTSYGSSAACSARPGSGTEVLAVVGGLTPGTTYHFRISATNVGGTSTGADSTFSTPHPGGHYYVNGAKLKEGVASTKTFIAWGNITLKGTKGSILGGHVTCHTAAAGTLVNPTGGGAGEGLFEQYAPFSCEQELICPSGTTRVAETAEKLPWHDLLFEEVGGTIRQETTGVKIDIVCFEGSTIIAELKFVTETPERGLRPKTVEGSGALHPRILEYASEAGELELERSPGGPAVKPEGALKLLGYNAQELIALKNP